MLAPPRIGSRLVNPGSCVNATLRERDMLCICIPHIRCSTRQYARYYSQTEGRLSIITTPTCISKLYGPEQNFSSKRNLTLFSASILVIQCYSEVPQPSRTVEPSAATALPAPGQPDMHYPLPASSYTTGLLPTDQVLQIDNPLLLNYSDL